MMARHLYFIALIFFLPETAVMQITTKNFYQIQKEVDSLYNPSEKYDGNYTHWKRAEYYMQTRLGPKGAVVNTGKRKWNVWKEEQTNRKYSSQRAYSGDWELFGPLIIEENPGIGRVNRIAFHPSDPDKLYVATAGGGLFYTFNHGTFWTSLTESLPVNNISGVAIDYTNPDIIYILTGDGDGYDGSPRSYGLQKSSIGVLKSTDSGETWTTTGLIFEETDEVWPYDLVIHPQNPEILFAITSTGVFRTVNGGDLWEQMLEGRFYELHFKIDEPSTVFAVAEGNIYRSMSLGLNWDTIPIPQINSLKGRMTMATCSSDPDIIYVAASPDIDSFSYRGLFLSTDAGLSFNFVSNSPNVMDNQAWYDLTMACNPENINDILIGVVSVWKSTDGGETLEDVGGTHADVHDFQFNPINNRLYVGTDGGLYYSDDFGDSWIFISEICPITQYYKIAVSQQNAEIVIAGAQDNGTHRNKSGASTVMDKILGKDGMDCAIHPLNDSLMIYSCQQGEFWMSVDQGETPDSLIHAPSLPSSVIAPWVTLIAWDPTDPDNIFLGYDPIYRSFDRGATFNPIQDTISGNRILYITPGNNQRLYAGDIYTLPDDNSTFHLWTSMDQGDNWTAIHTSPTFPDTSFVISGLCTNPTDDQDVWICLGGWEEGQKIYRSVNAGTSWINMSGSLPNAPVNTIILHDTGGSPEYAVYIGTDLGVYYRDATLGDWIPFSNGLPIVEISDLEINKEEGVILAGTYGRGIWSADLFSSCQEVIVITPVVQRDDHSYFFQAADAIFSDVLVDPSFGITIVYKAGNAVSLQEGFRATSKNGALFRAFNGECDEGGVPVFLLPNNGIKK